MTEVEAQRLAADEGLQLVLAPGTPTGYKGVTGQVGSVSKPFITHHREGGTSHHIGCYASAAEAALAFARYLGPAGCRAVIVVGSRVKDSRGTPGEIVANNGAWLTMRIDGGEERSVRSSSVQLIRQASAAEEEARRLAEEEARRLAAEEGDSSEDEDEEAEASAKPPTAEGGRSCRERKSVDYTSNRVSYEMSGEAEAVQAVQAAPKRDRLAEADREEGEEEEEEPAMQDYGALPPAVERLGTSPSKLRKLIPTNEPLSRVKKWVETLEVSPATHAPTAPR